MIKSKKYPILKIKIFLNLGIHQFYKIFFILKSTYIILKDNKENIFYVNNSIN